MIGKCYICGLCKKIASSKNGMLCYNCYSNKNKEKCSICCNLSVVNTRIDGMPICQECNRKKDICDICKKYKKIKKKEGDSKICGPCRYKLRLETCILCSNLSQVAERIGNFPICPKCYKGRHKEKCSICDKDRPVKIRSKELAICEACYKKSKIGICFTCKKEKPLNNCINGSKVCSNCYHKNNIKICIICNKNKIVAIKNSEGSICHNCYKKQRLVNDINYLIKNRIRKRIREILKSQNLNRVQIYKDLYIDFQKVFEFLGKCPGNSNEYHIDHIFPLSIFDLSNPIEFQIACSPENLQWLLKEDNLKKGSLYKESDLKDFKERMIMKYNLNA